MRMVERIGTVAILGLLLAACSATPSRTPVPDAELQMIGAGELELARECAVQPGAIYRTHYTVGTDGQASVAAPLQPQGCVEQSLSRWVTTFRYVPPAAATPAVIDWMATVARRIP
jgi:hypothetical protein